MMILQTAPAINKPTQQNLVSQVWLRRLELVVALTILLAVMLAVSGWLWQQSSVLTFQDDAAQTLSAAHHLQQGNGYASSVIYYDSQLEQDGLARQTVWPPALAALAAGLSAVTQGSLASSMLAVLLAAHLLTALLLGWAFVLLGQRSGVGARFAQPTAGASVLTSRSAHTTFPHLWLALGASIAWMINVPAMLSVSRGLAEPLYQMFAVLALVALIAAVRPAEIPRERSGETGSAVWLVLASVAVAGAVLSRYQAIALVGPLAAAAAIVAGPGASQYARVRSASFASLLPTVVVGGLFVRNWMITGSLTGGAQADGGQSLAEVAARIGWLPASLQMPVLALLLTSCLVSLVVAALLWIRGFNACRSRPAACSRRARVAIIFSLGAYGANLGMLIALSLMSTVYVIEIRYLTVSALFLVVPAVLVSTMFVRQVLPVFAVRKRTALLAIVVAGVAVGQFFAFQGSMQMRLTEAPATKLAKILSTHQIEGQSVLDWISRLSGQPAVLMSSHAHSLSLVLNNRGVASTTVIGVPLPVFTKSAWSASQIEALAQRHSVHYLLAFRQLPTWVFRDPVNQLLDNSDEATDWMTPILETKHLFLARIGPSTNSSPCPSSASGAESIHAALACD